MSNQSESIIKRRPTCLDDPAEDLDDDAVLAWIIRALPGGRNKYGYRAMAEKILDMLDAEGLVLTRCDEGKPRADPMTDCRERGGILGGPTYECLLPRGHSGAHGNGWLSWER